jgi:hypothetical protein
MFQLTRTKIRIIIDPKQELYKFIVPKLTPTALAANTA